MHTIMLTLDLTKHMTFIAKQPTKGSKLGWKYIPIKKCIAIHFFENQCKINLGLKWVHYIFDYLKFFFILQDLCHKEPASFESWSCDVL
jgi:hypothetical protein